MLVMSDTVEIFRSGQEIHCANATQASRGRYRCCAKTAQQQFCSDDVTVDVIDPPILRQRWSDKIIRVEYGTRAFKLSIDVTYALTSFCAWYKDGFRLSQLHECHFPTNGLIELKLPFHKDSNDSSLIDYDDSGQYNFTLHAVLFPDVDSTVSVTLIVVGPPVAPDAPSVSVIGHSSVSVTVSFDWSIIGNRDMGPDVYLLQYAPAGTTEWVTRNVSVNVSPGMSAMRYYTRVVNISRLRPCAIYNVRTLAENKHGVSTSPIVEVTLPPVSYDEFPLYSDHSNDRFVTSSQNGHKIVCLPPRLSSTKFGNSICHLPEDSNLNKQEISSLSVLRVTLSCAEGEEAPNCTSVCPLEVDECLEGRWILSRQEICSYNVPHPFSETTGTSKPTTRDSNHGVGVSVSLGVVVAGVVGSIVIGWRDYHWLD